MHFLLSNLRRSLLLALFASLIWLPVPGLAQSPGGNPSTGITLSAQAGFDAFCKDNHWIPVFVTLENTGPDLEGRVEVRIPGQGDSGSVFSTPVSLANTSRKQVELDVYPEGYISALDVSLYSGNQRLAQVSARLNCLPGQNNLIFGVVSDNPSAFSILSSLAPTNGTTNVAQIDPSMLPSQAQGLDSLDLIIFSDVDTGSLTPAQQQALAGWLAEGGKILISGGPAWQKTAAGLTSFLPFQTQGTQSIQSLDALQVYASSNKNLTGEAVIVTGTPQAKAIVLSEQNGSPLLIQQSYGAGSVIYATFDPSLSPVKNWDGLELLYRRLLTERHNLPGWIGGVQDWNMASQAAVSLPNQSLPSGLLLCGFLAFYVAAIGPLNYIVLKRLKRRELAWLSIPVLVIFFSGLAFLLGSQARGNTPILNRLAVVQVYPGVEQARIDGVIGVFSPNRSSYRLDFSPNLAPYTIPASYPDPKNLSIVQAGTVNSIDHLQVDVGAIEPVAFQGETPAPKFSSNLQLVTDGAETWVKGKITNSSSLTLKDAVFLAPGHAQTLGQFLPGETRDIQVKLDTAQRSGQSTPSAVNLGYPPSGVTTIYPSYPGDTTVQDIVGSANYYDNQEYYRRFSLVSSIMGWNQGGARGGGFYLAGWSDAFPEEMSLYSGSQKRFESTDHTLYLVTFQPEIQPTGQAMTFSPGAFTWTALEGAQNYQASPYNTYLTNQGMVLQFDLIQPVQYSAVQSLTLHIHGANYPSPSYLTVELWDYQRQAWEKQDVQQWGDFSVTEPQKYLSPGGQIQMKMGLTAGNVTESINQADFTLVLEP